MRTLASVARRVAAPRAAVMARSALPQYQQVRTMAIGAGELVSFFPLPLL